MSKVFCSLLLLICSVSLFSQNNEADQEAFAVCLNGKWGAQNKFGELVVEKIYDHVSIDRYNHILVSRKDSFGILNKDGNVILPVEFNSIEAVSANLFITEKNNIFGLFKNSPGKFIFDHIYNEIVYYENDYFILKKGSSYFLYDHTKRFLTKPFNGIYKTGKKYNVFILERNSKEQMYVGSKGYISEACDTVIKAQHNLYFLEENNKRKVLAVFDKIYFFETDTFYYREFTKDRLFIKDTKRMRLLGTDVDTSFNFDKVSDVFSFKIKSDRINTISDFIDFDDSDKFAYISHNGKTGVINNDLRIIIKPEFEKITKYGKSNFKLWNNDKIGFASLLGKIIVPCNYDKIRPRFPFIYVTNENGEGVYSFESGKIIDNKYDRLSYITQNFFYYTKDNIKGIVMSLNREITSARFSSISKTTNGFIVSEIISGKKKLGFINNSGETVLPSEYDKLTEIRAGMLKVGKKGGNRIYYGLFNDKGKKYLPFSYSNIKVTNNYNIYQIYGFESVDISIRHLNYIRGLELSIPRYDSNKTYHPTGYVNTFGEMLVDTFYLPPQISADFSNNIIQVLYRYGVQLISFESNGKIYDKVEYSNFVKVYESTIKKEFTWKLKEIEGVNLWGLYWNQFKVLKHEFHDIIEDDFGEGYNGVTENGRIGLVNMKTGKLIFEPVYWKIDSTDLNSFRYIVAPNIYGRFDFMDQNYRVIKKGFGFVGDIQKSYLRVNKGGKTREIDEKKQPQYIINMLAENNYKTCIRGKWGVMNSDAVYTVQPQYDFMQEYLHGGFIVKTNSKWGKISPNNEVLIDCIYDDIKFFTELKLPPINSIVIKKSLIKSEIPYYKAKFKGKWGVIDTAGIVVVPFQYNDIICEYDSVSTVFITVISSANNLYGYLDEAGKMRSVPKFIVAEKFKNGFARVQLKYDEWVYIDTALNILPCGPFSEANDFSEGLAAVEFNGKWGFIDERGNFTIKPEFSKAGDFSGGMAPVYRSLKNTILENKKRTTGSVYINKNNDIVINKYFDYCSPFYNNASIVRVDGKYGLINNRGKFILPLKFDHIVMCDESGIFKAKRKKKYFLYDYTGEKVYHLKKIYSKCIFGEGLCVLRSGNKYDYIDYEGNVILSIKAKYAENFKYGKAIIYDNSGYSCINKQGKALFTFNENDKNNNVFVLKEAVFLNPKNQIGRNLYVITDDLFNSIKGKKYLCKTNQEKIIIQGVSEIKEFSEGLAAFGVNKLYGIYNVKGEQSAKDQYLKIEKIQSDLYKLKSLNEISYIKINKLQD